MKIRSVHVLSASLLGFTACDMPNFKTGDVRSAQMKKAEDAKPAEGKQGEAKKVPFGKNVTLEIAGDICIYTNRNIEVEAL